MKKFIQYMKLRIFRDAFDFLLIFINLVILLFLLFNSVNLLYEMRSGAELDRQYNNQVLMGVIPNDLENVDISYVDTLLYMLESIPDAHPRLLVSLPVGDTSDVYEVGILFGTSHLLAPLQNRTEEMFQGGVFIGETFLETLQELNGDSCVSLLNEKYPVTAVYRNEIPGGYDDRITVFWHTLLEDSKIQIKEKLLENFSYGGFPADIELNADTPLDDLYTDFTEALAEDGFSCETRETSRNANYQSWLYISLSRLGIIVISLFAFGNCYIATTMWVGRRREEFAIRKAFGADGITLFFVLLKDVLRCVALALPCTVVLQIIYLHTMGASRGVVTHQLVELGAILLGLLAIILFATLIPLYQVCKRNPAEEIG